MRSVYTVDIGILSTYLLGILDELSPGLQVGAQLEFQLGPLREVIKSSGFTSSLCNLFHTNPGIVIQGVKDGRQVEI